MRQLGLLVEPERPEPLVERLVVRVEVGAARDHRGAARPVERRRGRSRPSAATPRTNVRMRPVPTGSPGRAGRGRTRPAAGAGPQPSAADHLGEPRRRRAPDPRGPSPRRRACRRRPRRRAAPPPGTPARSPSRSSRRRPGRFARSSSRSRSTAPATSRASASLTCGARARTICDLALQRRVIDPVVEAPSLQRVVQLARAVRRDDDRRRRLGRDPPDLGDRHRELRQISSRNASNSSSARSSSSTSSTAPSPRADRREQRPLHQELRTEQVLHVASRRRVASIARTAISCRE